MKSGKTVSGQTKFFFLLLPLVVLFNYSAACYAADIYVDDDACPGPGTGISGDPFCSIQDAIDQASNGDDVLVTAGTYDEVLVMKSGVDVLAAGVTAPVIAPTFYSTNMIVFDGVDDVTLDGFVLDTTFGGTAFARGIIHLDGSTTSSCLNVTINNCELKGYPTFGSRGSVGITMEGEVTLTITGNTIYNNCFAAITTGGMSGHYLVNSTLSITGNTIQDNGTAGIMLRGSGSGNRVIIGESGVNGANSFINNGHAGYFGGAPGIRLVGLDEVSIENNDILNSKSSGILLVNVSTVAPHISHNNIYNNEYAGINIGGNSQVMIDNNYIYDNALAGITFYTAANSNIGGVASSLPVSITGNAIYGNGYAGVAVIDHVTGPVTVDGNDIYQNTKAGIGVFNAVDLLIQNNTIHTHTTAAGIFTGDWSGTYPPAPSAPPSSMSFDRTNGPANLTIRLNKIYGNRSGMRLDHASGTISNNLVYNNAKAGIRYSGNNISPYAPFGSSWGITSLTNNTLADNGTATVITAEYTERRGGGMAYDDINDTTDRTFFDPPRRNTAQSPRFIQNNIAAYNATTGIRDAACTTERDFNLYYFNFGNEFSVNAQTGGCGVRVNSTFIGNPNEIFAAPLFIDRIEYRLMQPGSPGIGSGNDTQDMGAYGGSNPIAW